VVIYRDAAVYVNGNLAGQWACGYSRFTVHVDPFGAANEIRVECGTHLDSRWSAGAGIYRDVQLIVKNLGRVAHEGVRVTTPSIEPGAAVVEAAVEIENAGPLTNTYRLDAVAVSSSGEVNYAVLYPAAAVPTFVGGFLVLRG